MNETDAAYASKNKGDALKRRAAMKAATSLDHSELSLLVAKKANALDNLEIFVAAVENLRDEAHEVIQVRLDDAESLARKAEALALDCQKQLMLTNTAIERLRHHQRGHDLFTDAVNRQAGQDRAAVERALHASDSAKQAAETVSIRQDRFEDQMIDFRDDLRGLGISQRHEAAARSVATSSGGPTDAMSIITFQRMNNLADTAIRNERALEKLEARCSVIEFRAATHADIPPAPVVPPPPPYDDRRIFRMMQDMQNKIDKLEKRRYVEVVIQLQVKDLEGKTVMYNVKASDTIDYVKLLIRDKTNIPLDTFRLSFCGNVMLNEHTLDKYDVQDGSTVWMLFHLNGGGCGIDDEEDEFKYGDEICDDKFSRRTRPKQVQTSASSGMDAVELYRAQGTMSTVHYVPPTDGAPKTMEEALNHPKTTINGRPVQLHQRAVDTGHIADAMRMATSRAAALQRKRAREEVSSAAASSSAAPMVRNDIDQQAPAANISEYDLAIMPGLGSVGCMALYRAPRHAFSRTVSRCWHDLEDRLELLGANVDPRHTFNLVLRYRAGTLDSIADALFTRSDGRDDLALCVGGTDSGEVVAYLRKVGSRKWFDCKVDDVVPEMYRLRYKGIYCTKISETMQILVNVMCECQSTVHVRAPSSGAYSFEQLLEGFIHLTEPQRETLRGQCQMVAAGRRSEFQKLFLAQFQCMTKVAQLRANAISGDTVWHAANPIQVVIGLGDLVNLDQKGTRLDETTNRDVTYTLRDVFEQAELMAKYGIILLGPDGTSGFGKSQLAQRLAIHWTLARAQAMGLQPAEAMVAMTNTMDLGNKIDFKTGWCWVLDEFMPADKEAQVYCSESSLKVLLSPMAPGSIRARNTDAKIPAGVARIVTANAGSLAEWLGEPLMAGKKGVVPHPIRRKAITFVIKKRLCSPQWVAAANSSTGVDPTVTMASTIMVARVQEALGLSVAAPAPVMGLFGCPRRQ